MTTKEKKYCYEYPRPALTSDCIIFGFDNFDLTILLIERAHEPFKNKWALPGGFVDMNETTETGALRELYEETGLKNVFIEQLYTFSDVDRDPRGRVVSVAYYALIKLDEYSIHAGDDAGDANWFPVNDLPELAFDHHKIIEVALQRLKGKIRYQPIGFELLPPMFTLTQLQNLYETILQRELDKRNFRKKILKMNLLIPMDEKQKNVAHKAARFYKFDKQKYEELTQKGYNFEI
jgi:8-oxo-dGTP diphosphatase